jgi:DNA-binding transcriptional MerR regulator
MSHTVGEVAKIAKVSVRALHHWDEIGLVKPSGRSRAGYRLYTASDLDRLQQVLFFRELGFRLEDIARTLADPAFDRRRALVTQRALLLERLERSRALVALVDRTLREMDGEETMPSKTKMKPEEKFEAFGEHDPEAYEAEAEARWGETESFRISRERTARYSKDDWKKIRAEADRIHAALADAMARGLSPDAPEVRALAEEHRQHIDRWFYPCSPAMHAGLGRMYVDDPRFAATYERVREGLAAFLRDAIRAAQSS